MTLILTIGNSQRLIQSSDFQLVDPHTGLPVSDEAGSKQLSAQFEDLLIGVAFTGVVTVRRGGVEAHIAEVLSGVLKTLPATGTTLQLICDIFTKSCEAALSGLSGPNAVLTLVITAAAIAMPLRVAVLSNADWRKRPPIARSRFTTRIETIRHPYVLISGLRDCVPQNEVWRLEALAKRAEERVDGPLREVNALAAANSGGWVSQKCWITSLSRGSNDSVHGYATNLDQQDGIPPHVHGGIPTDVLEHMIKQHLRPAPGKRIGVRQRAFGSWRKPQK